MLLLGILLFLHGTCVFGHSTDVMLQTLKCANYKPAVEPSKNLMETPEAFDNMCKQQQLFYECLENVARSQDSKLPQALLQAQLLTEKMCSSEFLWRKRYLDMAPCINQQRTEFCTSVEFLKAASNGVSVQDDCHLHDKSNDCTAAILSMNCGAEAGTLFSYLLKISSYNFIHCKPDASKLTFINDTDTSKLTIYSSLLRKIGDIPEETEEVSILEQLGRVDDFSDGVYKIQIETQDSSNSVHEMGTTTTNMLPAENVNVNIFQQMENAEDSSDGVYQMKIEPDESSDSVEYETEATMTDDMLPTEENEGNMLQRNDGVGIISDGVYQIQIEPEESSYSVKTENFPYIVSDYMVSTEENEDVRKIQQLERVGDISDGVDRTQPEIEESPDLVNDKTETTFADFAGDHTLPTEGEVYYANDVDQTRLIEIPEGENNVVQDGTTFKNQELDYTQSLDSKNEKISLKDEELEKEYENAYSEPMGLDTVVIYNYPDGRIGVYWKQPGSFSIDSIKCQHLQREEKSIFQCRITPREKDPNCLEESSSSPAGIIDPKDIDPEFGVKLWETHPKTSYPFQEYLPESSKYTSEQTEFITSSNFETYPENLDQVEDTAHFSDTKEANLQSELADESLILNPSRVGDLMEEDKIITWQPSQDETTRTAQNEEISTDRSLPIHSESLDKLAKIFTITSQSETLEENQKSFPDYISDEMVHLFSYHGLFSQTAEIIHDLDGSFQMSLADRETSAIDSLTCGRVNECHPKAKSVFKCVVVPRHKSNTCDGCSTESSQGNLEFRETSELNDELTTISPEDYYSTTIEDIDSLENSETSSEIEDAVPKKYHVCEGCSTASPQENSEFSEMNEVKHGDELTTITLPDEYTMIGDVDLSEYLETSEPTIVLVSGDTTQMLDQDDVSDPSTPTEHNEQLESEEPEINADDIQLLVIGNYSEFSDSSFYDHDITEQIFPENLDVENSTNE